MVFPIAQFLQLIGKYYVKKKLSKFFHRENSLSLYFISMDCRTLKVKVQVTESCPTLCNHSPWNSPGQNPAVGSLSLLQGIFPTQGLNPGLPHCRQILYQLHRGSPEPFEVAIILFLFVAKLCPSFCNPIYCSLPGSSVHGISQARLLESVTISFSRGSSQPRD